MYTYLFIHQSGDHGRVKSAAERVPCYSWAGNNMKNSIYHTNNRKLHAALRGTSILYSLKPAHSMNEGSRTYDPSSLSPAANGFVLVGDEEQVSSAILGGRRRHTSGLRCPIPVVLPDRGWPAVVPPGLAWSYLQDYSTCPSHAIIFRNTPSGNPTIPRRTIRRDYRCSYFVR